MDCCEEENLQPEISLQEHTNQPQPSYSQPENDSTKQPQFQQPPPIEIPPAAAAAVTGIPVQNPLEAHGNWTTGLFDCMEDPENAIETFFFPCCTFGEVAEIVDDGETSLLYLIIMNCSLPPCILSCGFRSMLRKKFGLVESPLPDWAVHLFFEPCALCQEYRELKNRGLDPSLGWNKIKKQQQQQGQVAMAPPPTQTMKSHDEVVDECC
ncbi:PREDICTED: protein PLANT CADMIUM RESISTANCE 7-like isoform X2 [Nelumbo nucifera]|uniref:Protein PLANT CADMIUM RESISTANCE 7-like isoform X2 n=1 Tax=Nelumbo nucifera TaxID=4432 RepID=A0A1U8Q627_NELNU|nr:PREDICTED: protein PLANT CADMIUM RESISTANCE 7-like isoform X2 [Nelumbo nucifera]